MAQKRINVEGRTETINATNICHDSPEYKIFYLPNIREYGLVFWDADECYFFERHNDAYEAAKEILE